MLQQGELGVVRCEKESARGVHLDSKVGRVKRMHLIVHRRFHQDFVQGN